MILTPYLFNARIGYICSILVGSDSECKKWIHFFESVTSIVFCAALSKCSWKSRNGQSWLLIVFAKHAAHPFRDVELYGGVIHSVRERHQLALVPAHTCHSVLEQDRCVLVRFPRSFFSLSLLVALGADSPLYRGLLSRRFRSKNITPLDPISTNPQNTYYGVFTPV
jgi:hypothetical protein